MATTEIELLEQKSKKIIEQTTSDLNEIFNNFSERILLTGNTSLCITSLKKYIENINEMWDAILNIRQETYKLIYQIEHESKFYAFIKSFY